MKRSASPPKPFESGNCRCSRTDEVLIDNALSPDVAALLQAAGHDAVHVRTRGLQTADDPAVFKAALEEARVLVSADTDFGAMLTLGQLTGPSVILFRHGSPRRPREQAGLLLGNLASFQDDLEHGAIVEFRQDKIRVRRLTKKTEADWCNREHR